MAKKNKKLGKGKTTNNNANSIGSSDDLILVDPSRIRFQHARIRPYFSGCGRSVVQTLNDIRDGKLQPEALPPIQVLVGPDDWYFSLNNRRLWVLKRCREEGLLKDNQIPVRIRQPKSQAEAQRYTLEMCALEAKFMREKDPNASSKREDGMKDDDEEDEKQNVKEPDPVVGFSTNVDNETVDDVLSTMQKIAIDEPDEHEDSSDDDGDVRDSNPFSALF